MNGRDGTTAFLPFRFQNRWTRWMEPSYCTTVFNQRTDKIHIQKIETGNNKHRHDRTRDRAKKTDKMDDTSGESNP